MKSTKTGKTEQHRGATIAEYTDGAWRYTGDGGKTKGALARKPAWLTSFTPKTSIIASDRKRTLKQEDAELGLMRAMEEMTTRKIRTGHEGMQFVYEKQAELATSPDMPGSTAAAKFVESAFYGGTHKETPKIEIHMDNATIIAGRQTERMIEELEEPNTIEGDFAEI